MNSSIQSLINELGDMKCTLSGDYATWNGARQIKTLTLTFREAIDKLLYVDYVHTFHLERTGKKTFHYTESTHDCPTGGTHLIIRIK